MLFFTRLLKNSRKVKIAHVACILLGCTEWQGPSGRGTFWGSEDPRPPPPPACPRTTERSFKGERRSAFRSARGRAAAPGTAPDAPPGMGASGAEVPLEHADAPGAGAGHLPVQGERLVQVQALAEVLPLRAEGVQLGGAGPVLLPLVLPAEGGRARGRGRRGQARGRSRGQARGQARREGAGRPPEQRVHAPDAVSFTKQGR